MIGERMKQLRKNKKLTLEQLANDLNKKYPNTMNFNKGKLSKWENGKEEPKLSSIRILADYYGIAIDDFYTSKNTNPLIDSKYSIEKIFNKLEDIRKDKVYSFAKRQLEEQNNKIVNLQNFKEEKQRFEFPWKGYVSAGTGEYMDGETNETICLYEDEIPDEADFALTINGDSMKPMFKDHETIFVKKTNELQSGSIGIVIVNDESYIKKIYYGQFSMTLVSLNSEYDDVHVDRNDNVKFIGKVIL